MKIEFLPNGKTKVTISDEEKFELTNLKTEFIDLLDKYVYEERFELDIEMTRHLKNSQKVNELLNIRYYIINDLDYNEEYKNLLSIDTGHIEFTNYEEFLCFASSFQILEDTTRAIRILKNIVRVKLIERMIELDYPNNDLKITFHYNKSYSKEHSDIFTPYGLELFNYFDKNWDTHQHFTKFAEIYNFMYNSLSKNYSIKCSKIQFENFIKNNIPNKKFSKIGNSKNDIKTENYLNDLKNKFIIEYDTPKING